MENYLKCKHVQMWVLPCFVTTHAVARMTFDTVLIVQGIFYNAPLDKISKSCFEIGLCLVTQKMLGKFQEKTMLKRGRILTIPNLQLPIYNRFSFRAGVGARLNVCQALVS